MLNFKCCIFKSKFKIEEEIAFLQNLKLKMKLYVSFKIQN